MKDDDKKNDTKNFEKVWKSIRKDGAYVEAGENDNVIVQKLEANKDAYGVFGYSFLEENGAKLKGVADRRRRARITRRSRRQVQGRPSALRLREEGARRRDPRHRQVRRRVRLGEGHGEDGYLSRKGLVTLPKEEAD